jgi:transposase InsO family protein
MAQRGVDVNIKLVAVLARQASGQGSVGRALSVKAICAELGISRKTYYVAAARFAESGFEGLLPRSRRPAHSPGQTPAAMEDAIVRVRKELDDEGLDNGPVSIDGRLRTEGVTPPATATIHRVLTRRGLIIPQPQKRPDSSWKRFNFTERNGCWQIDAFFWKLADGTSAAIFQLTDDCTRLEIDTRAAPRETSEAALACFLTGVDRYGVPSILLSDNGLAFSGARRGWRSSLENAAARLGCKTVQSSPYHPQTCGKNERAHQTCQRWLRRQPAAADLTELQGQLDRYRDIYNNRRPHQALGGRTPAQAAAEAPLAKLQPNTVVPQQSITRFKVKPNGDIGNDHWAMSVGRPLKGQIVTVIRDGDNLTVLHGSKLIRELTLDRSRHYQPRKPKPLDQRPSQ